MMKYLIDTHVVIWYCEDSLDLPEKIYKIIDNCEDNIYISSASLWEIAIKMNIGKLSLKLSLGELLAYIKNSDFNILQIEDEYLKKLACLPLIHKDPFDRLLVSTALAEKLTIITADENIHGYDVSWIW